MTLGSVEALVRAPLRVPFLPSARPGLTCPYPPSSWQNYVDFHKCVNAKGQEFPPCKQFLRTYRSLCPNDWIEKWDEQVESNTVSPTVQERYVCVDADCIVCLHSSPSTSPLRGGKRDGDAAFWWLDEDGGNQEEQGVNVVDDMGNAKRTRACSLHNWGSLV